MAGTAEYDFHIYFTNGTFQRVRSLAPIKSTGGVTFVSGTYRDQNGGSAQNNSTGYELAYISIPNQDILFEMTSGTATTIAPGGALTSVADDAAHIAPRKFTEYWDCWVFTNLAGDVVASPRCIDVLNFSPYEPNVAADGNLVDPPSVITPSNTVTFTATKFIFVAGAGNLAVVLDTGGLLIIPVVANTLYGLAVTQIKSTGTTATGIVKIA